MKWYSKTNAFTLIELLGVIVLIGLLSLIAIPAINNTLDNNRDKLYNAQLATIKSGLKAWGDENHDLLPTANAELILLTLDELKYWGFADYNIKNPNTEKCFNDEMILTIKKTTKGYEYLVDDSIEETECKKISEYPSITVKGAGVMFVRVNRPINDEGADALATITTVYYDATLDELANLNNLSEGLYTIKYSVTINNKTSNAYRKIKVVK